MGFPRIELTTDGINKTVISVDGVKIEGVRKIEFGQSAGELPTIKLDLVACNMAVDMPMVLDIPDVYKPFYELKETDKDA